MEEFQIPKVNESMWTVTGKQLCQMTMEEFHEKVPADKHNMLWTHIELLRKCGIFGTVSANYGDCTVGISLTYARFVLQLLQISRVDQFQGLALLKRNRLKVPLQCKLPKQELPAHLVLRVSSKHHVRPVLYVV